MFTSRFSYILHAPRMPADPVNSLWQKPLRHQSFETPLCRFYNVPIPLGGTQGGGRGGQGKPRGPKGAQREPKGAFGALGGDGPMGHFGVIPKLFRMESNFEWSLNCAGKGTLISKLGEIVPTSRNGAIWSNIVPKRTIWSIWATMGPK